MTICLLEKATGKIIDSGYRTIKDALADIELAEDVDKWTGEYKPNAYDIIDENGKSLIG